MNASANMNKCECKAIMVLDTAVDGTLKCLMEQNTDQTVSITIYLLCYVAINLLIVLPSMAVLWVKITNAFWLFVS